MAIPSDRPVYFWICSRLNDFVLDAGSANPTAATQVVVNPRVQRPVNNQLSTLDSQLWTLDSEGYIVSKTNGFVLDVRGSWREPGTSVIVYPKNSPQTPNQLWDWAGDSVTTRLNGFSLDVCESSTLPGTKVISYPQHQPKEPNQQWYALRCVPLPDTSSNQFDEIAAGSVFSIRNCGDDTAIRVGSGSAVLSDTVSVDPPPNEQLWTYSGGQLVNLANGGALMAYQLPEVSDPRTWPVSDPGPATTWRLTTDGYLVNGYFRYMMNRRYGPNIPPLTSSTQYDLAVDPLQRWRLELVPSAQFGTATSSGPTFKRSDQMTSSIGWDATIASVWVEVTLYTPFNTEFDPYFRFSSGNWKLLPASMRNPDLVFSRLFDVGDLFGGGRSISLADLSTLSLRLFSSASYSVSALVRAVIVTATNRMGESVTNRFLQEVDCWTSTQATNETRIIWSKMLPIGAWSKDEQPVDLAFKTYRVGLLPYIGDVLRWRSYDPSSIDGVGILAGRINGQLIGEQLKTRQTEILKPGRYTWVYTSATYAIVYKAWPVDQPLGNYTRHSQLGSGAPVICAGVMVITSQWSTNSVQSVITLVNTESGHYRPDGGACLRPVSDKLQSLGIPTDGIEWGFFPGNTE